jgi:hypothetical protein
MHQLIVSPFLGEYFILCLGSSGGIKVPHSKCAQLRRAAAKREVCPTWLIDAVRRAWSLDIGGRPTGNVLLVRPQSPYGFGRASHELNLGCNYDYEHCYLVLKTFEGMSWPDRKRLYAIRDSGVLWLQLTGGCRRGGRVPCRSCCYLQGSVGRWCLGSKASACLNQADEILANASKLTLPISSGQRVLDHAVLEAFDGVQPVAVEGAYECQAGLLHQAPGAEIDRHRLCDHAFHP